MNKNFDYGKVILAAIFLTLMFATFQTLYPPKSEKCCGMPKGAY